MKKIIHVTDTLNTGGAERVAVDLANQLVAEGFHVFFCATRQGGDLDQELSKDITYFCLHRKSTLNGLSNFRSLIRKNKISLIHAHGNSTASFCVVATLGMNVKIVHHDHNPLLENRSAWKEKIILKRCHAWIAVSNPILNWVSKNVGYKDVVMLSNPVNTKRFLAGKRHSTEKTVGVVLANYRPQKDYENLLKAVQQLNQSITINCYGAHAAGSYYQAITELCNTLELNDIVKLNAASSDVPNILANSDFGILPSEDEGLPISLLEYMVSGLPVVVTDVGECGKIVKEAACGFVVPPKRSDLLANAIVEILKNRPLWPEWGSNGKRYIENNHSIEAFVKVLMNSVYNKFF